MAVRCLLDTSICIYIAKRHPSEVMQHFERLQTGDVAMSLITYGELQFGAEKSRMAKQVYKKLEHLAELIPVLPLTEKVSNHYGWIRAKLEQAGTPIGANDLWIAAHARAEGLILVSNNIREFERIPGLKLENWVA